MPKSINKISKHKRNEVLQEIKRLSKLMYDDEVGETDVKSMLFLINNLASVLQGMPIDEFHQRVEGASEQVRTFYYELLFE